MNQFVTLAHGNGGRLTRELIENYFAKYLTNPLLDTQHDSARLPPLSRPLVVTSDSFTVQPLVFPGGDIGSLAIHGTVNDLAVSGATPRFLTLNAILEEGFKFSLLEQILQSMAEAVEQTGVQLVTGDTKVVRKGEGSGLYLSMSGLGTLACETLHINKIQAGDAILVSGPIGDHGACVMMAREEFELESKLKSDCASIVSLATQLYDLEGLRFMRDPSRGGLGTILHEILHSTGLGAQLVEQQIPLRKEVKSLCEMLGFEPLHLACEGRIVAVVNEGSAAEALARWQSLPEGKDASMVGQVKNSPQVSMITELGGERVIRELEEEPLPRIC